MGSFCFKNKTKPQTQQNIVKEYKSVYRNHLLRCLDAFPLYFIFFFKRSFISVI